MSNQAIAVANPTDVDFPADVRQRLDEINQRPVLLDLDGLNKIFISPTGQKIQALSDFDLRIHQRELITVVGPSGCGKSTMIRIIAGFETPTTGEVRLDGNPIETPGADRGMVFQSYTLFPWLSVKDNVKFGLKMANDPAAKSDEVALEWIDTVGLSGFADHYPHQLSGGMKQRVAIARALAPKPRILMMDEPFGALDARTRAQMQNHLLEIWRDVDVTILFITHDLDEAVYLADRVLVLGSHPGHIKALVDVPLPRPRQHEQIFDPRFVETKRYVEHLIHPPEDKG
ncbi:MAG: ABC transporter ATP-binding protein [Planctomycetota bacterium]